jgi:hypothetical protein
LVLIFKIGRYFKEYKAIGQILQTKGVDPEV